MYKNYAKGYCIGYIWLHNDFTHVLSNLTFLILLFSFFREVFQKCSDNGTYVPRTYPLIQY
jgi:hypothetical protein